LEAGTCWLLASLMMLYKIECQVLGPGITPLGGVLPRTSELPLDVPITFPFLSLICELV
jgi:hypothetical protein